MRAGEEFSELAELGGGGRYRWGSAHGCPSWGRTPATATNTPRRPRGGGGGGGGNNGGPFSASFEAEDVMLGSAQYATPGGSARGRSGLYYSPPGTSYTIVERPSSSAQHYHHHHQQQQQQQYGNAAKINPRGTYLGSGTNFSQRNTITPTAGNNNRSNNNANNKKRPISPEQVLRLFGNQQQQQQQQQLSGPKGGCSSGSSEKPRRSPASSPASTTHQVNYPAPVTVTQQQQQLPPTARIPYVSSSSFHELSTRTVTMVRDPPDGTHGFGICVKGGKDSGIGVYISRVEDGSVAERAGLRPGDSILEVNGTPFTGISHEEALKMLKSCRKLSMTVRSPNLPPSGGGFGHVVGTGAPWFLRQTCSWMDRQGRPVSPPPEYVASSQGRFGAYPPARSSSKDRGLRRVDLCIEPGQSLGLMIRGGVEYNLGIFITGVDKESVADRAGLMVGDQILEVNGQSFLDVTHDEAVSQLKYHKRMSLLVRDVGKVPHSCTAYDRDAWDLASPGSRAASTRKWSAALQAVEEKARSVLPRNEFASLCYYTDEYAARHMTIDAFVQVMTELLNTADKYTLFTELREIVALEDRSRFDELVYRRDVESSSSSSVTRGNKDHHDYRHSRRKPGIPVETNHQMMPSMHDISGPDFGPGIEPGSGGFSEDEYRSPSEDSGLGLGIADRVHRVSQRPSSAVPSTTWHSAAVPTKTVTSDLALSNDEEAHVQEYGSGMDDEDEEEDDDIDRGGRGSSSRRHSSPGESPRSGGTSTVLQDQEEDYSDSSGYLGGLRSQLGGWTQKVKSWYWGRPLDDQALLEGESAGPVARHQSIRRLSTRDQQPQRDAADDEADGSNVVPDTQGNLRVTVRKTKPILGIAIEGGANTKHPLPRIINIHENGAAYSSGGLEVGQLILQVDGQCVEGLQHQDVARLIAESFARRDRPHIEFLVVEAKKSNLEPKPTALIFLEA